MGVLNVTPDSFSDGGRFADRAAALSHARAPHDRGGRGHHRRRRRVHASRRALPPALDEELERVIPIIEALRRESAVFISVDTSKPEVDARRAAPPARTSSTTFARCADPGALAGGRAHAGAGICLMHMQGEPRTMQDAPALRRTWSAKSARSWRRALRACRDAGIDARAARRRSGLRFRQAHRRQPRAAQTSRAVSRRWASPLAVGLSRKSMLGEADRA